MWERGRVDGMELPSAAILTILVLQRVDKHWKILPAMQHCAQSATFLG